MPQRRKESYMKKIIGRSAIATIALSSLLAPSAFAGDDDLKIGGFADFYYLYDFNRSGTQGTLNGRAFDVKNNTLSLSHVLITLRKQATEKTRFGFAADLSFGRFADINAGFDFQSGDSLRNFQQAYGTYLAKDGATLDFGKFNSWVGYESLYSVDNANYSIGTLFNNEEPNWHVGLRYLKPINDKSTLGFYLVNGWNETEDSNGSKTLGLSYARTWSDKLSTTFNWIGGNEGTNGVGLPGPGQSNVQMIDFTSTYKLNAKHTLAFNADYASSKAIEAGVTSGNWHGFSFYSMHKLSDANDIALRYSVTHDPNSLRILDPGANFVGGSSGSWTLTYNTRTTDKSLLRFEFRTDFANRQLFQDGFAGTSDRRNTFAISHVIKF